MEEIAHYDAEYGHEDYEYYSSSYVEGIRSQECGKQYGYYVQTEEQYWYELIESVKVRLHLRSHCYRSYACIPYYFIGIWELGCGIKELVRGIGEGE